MSFKEIQKSSYETPSKTIHQLNFNFFPQSEIGSCMLPSLPKLLTSLVQAINTSLIYLHILLTKARRRARLGLTLTNTNKFE
jgi:hypothetical protein